MRSVPIKLSFAEEVKTFVNTVNRYPYEVDLRAGRHVVDAKSILGLCISRPDDKRTEFSRFRINERKKI